MSDPTPKRDKISDLQLIARLWPFVRPFARKLWWVAVMTPLGVLAGIAQPLLVKHAIDDNISAGRIDGLGDVAALFMVVVAVGFTARAIGLYALQEVGLRTLADMRARIFTHVLGQGQRFFDTRTTGSLLTRTTTDVEAIYESISFGVVGLVTDSLAILGTLVAMLVLDWRLTLVAFAFAPIIIVIIEIFRRRLRALSTTIRKTLSRLNGYFAEQMYGMSVVQLHGAQESSRQTFRDLAYRYLEAYRHSNWWDAGLYAIMDGLSVLAIGVMLWYGALQFGVETHGITLGLLVAFIDYLDKIFVPIREFSGRIATIQRSVAALERIFDLLDSDERVKPGHAPIAHPQGGLSFEGVGFAYGPDRPAVLHDLTFEVSPGEVIALVGATGSGKSTIGKLLTRMYDGYTGTIRVDGQALSDVATNDLRHHISMVSQEPHLFDAKVAENISLWDPDIDALQVREAARLARAQGFIEGFADGFDHPITERGGNLSSGQKQLLAIARAMARDTPVVILDEATASVDSVTERLIDEAIDELFAHKTVLVIAHRLSTITKTDRILVLHHGRLVAQGTHEALMAAGGRYKLLVETGFAI